ncbi:MAG: HlyD family efflux transporter periplasmic adaptor subunit [Bacteriovoracaceae bacterium]|nr:HlyD family efflux transporter periplasmic adaptor subunit [Bacteroidota bacterium]
MKIPNLLLFIASLTPKKRIIYGAVVGIVLTALLFLLIQSQSSASNDIIITPVKGEFIVSITTTGELQAKNSIEIKGPEQARAAGIWQMKISNLIAEGTVVKQGQFVAELDKAEIANRLKESELSVQKLDAQYTQTVLDSTLTLSQARDELVNLIYGLEEKKIVLEQSSYEAPAVRRQAQIDYDRTERTIAQSKKNYVTKTKQSIAKIQAVEADLLKERQKMDILKLVMMQFTILAPADGMVVYAREWNGKKKIVGATVSPWEPTVATLPDLTMMESITYVNEVDIQKIAAGQGVVLRLDADPNKKLSGSVVQVANIGEQRPNSDSKVFEVRIIINDRDTTLRPAMTTSNEINVAKLSNVLSIPLEAVHTQDTITFVYVKKGGVIKQEVKLGLQNDNAAVVLQGLGENDKIFLSPPPDVSAVKIRSLKVPS